MKRLGPFFHVTRTLPFLLFLLPLSALQALGDREPSGLSLATEKEREGVKEEAMAVVCALTAQARHPEVLEEGGEGGGGGGLEVVGEKEKERVRQLLAGVLGEEEGRRLMEG